MKKLADLVVEWAQNKEPVAQHSSVHPVVVAALVGMGARLALEQVERVGFEAVRGSSVDDFAEGVLGEWAVCELCGQLWPVDCLGSKLDGGGTDDEGNDCESAFTCGSCARG